jgi:hypothetical protein
MDNLDLSRPMPQFGDTSVNLMNDARTWYNSLQITALHKVSNSLTLHGTETYSKTMDAGTWADQNYGIRARNVDGGDMRHTITLSGVWLLPVGRGRMLLPEANRIVDTAIGGWEFSSLFIMHTGTPQGVPGYYLNNAKISRHPLGSNPLYIDVFAPFGEQYENVCGQYVVVPYEHGSQSAPPWCNSTTGPPPSSYTNAWSYSGYDGTRTGVINFMDQPTYGAAPAIDDTGLRTAGSKQFDTNLSKNFSLVENFKLQIRIDAFNVLNHPEWSGGATSSSGSVNNGTIYKPTSVSNNPRVTQLSAKITW